MSPSRFSAFDRSLCTVKHFIGGAWTHELGDYLPATSVSPGVWSRSRAGLTSFSPFAVEDYTQPLPVELVRFTAVRHGANAELAWSTASEKNSKGFDVQVSTDGKRYRSLGFVASVTPTSAAPREYAFTDTEGGKAGVRYYRLLQTDLDGTTSPSWIRPVTFDGLITTTVSALPNPFGEQLTVEVVAAAAGSAQLSLVDALGRTVLNQTVAVTVGHNALTPVLPAHLTTGSYTLVTVVDGQRFHSRLVKQ